MTNLIHVQRPDVFDADTGEWVGKVGLDNKTTYSVSGDGSVDAASVQAALSSDQAGGRTALGLGTAATQASTAFATAAQGIDSREWTAATVDQAEAETGTATTRRAWTAQRVRQAIAAARPEVATWADLPAANTVTVGRTYTVLSTGWRVYSDGTNWRPVNGRNLVMQRCGSLASPIATLTGVTAGSFTLPVVPSIPAGMIAPHSRVYFEAMVRRTTATATAILQTRFGTTGGSSDQFVYAATFAATANSDHRISTYAAFDGGAASLLAAGAVADNATNTNQFADRSGNINTAATMQMSIGVGSANVADSFALLYYSMSVEG